MDAEDLIVDVLRHMEDLEIDAESKPYLYTETVSTFDAGDVCTLASNPDVGKALLVLVRCIYGKKPLSWCIDQIILNFDVDEITTECAFSCWSKLSKEVSQHSVSAPLLLHPEPHMVVSQIPSLSDIWTIPRVRHEIERYQNVYVR